MAKIAILVAQIPVLVILLVLRNRGVMRSRARRMWIGGTLEFFFILAALLIVEFIIRKP